MSDEIVESIDIFLRELGLWNCGHTPQTYTNGDIEVVILTKEERIKILGMIVELQKLG